MTLLEDLPHFSLWHEAASACLYATWRGRQSAPQARLQYDLIQWHLPATGSQKLLNDSLLDEDGWQEATDWLAHECFDKLAQAGLLVVAWVMPRHLGAHYDVNRLLAQLKQVQVDTFGDAQAAYDWLHSQPPVSNQPPPKLPSQQTAAAFAALAQPEQLTYLQQHGRPQLPRWEADYYVQPYLLPNGVIAELVYYAHSGTLYQVRLRTEPKKG